jgi:hypothetical protein
MMMMMIFNETVSKLHRRFLTISLMSEGFFESVPSETLIKKSVDKDVSKKLEKRFKPLEQKKKSDSTNLFIVEKQQKSASDRFKNFAVKIVHIKVEKIFVCCLK